MSWKRKKKRRGRRRDDEEEEEEEEDDEEVLGWILATTPTRPILWPLSLFPR